MEAIQVERIKEKTEYQNVRVEQEEWDLTSRDWGDLEHSGDCRKPNLLSVDPGEEEESQVNSVDQIFNKIMQENFIKVRRNTPIREHRRPIDKARKETPHSISPLKH